MFPSWLQQLARRSFSPPARPRRQPPRFRPILERLEERTVPETNVGVNPSAPGGGSFVQIEMTAGDPGPLFVETQNFEGDTEFVIDDGGGPLSVISFNTSNFFNTEPNVVVGDVGGFHSPLQFTVFLEGGNHTLIVPELQVGPGPTITGLRIEGIGDAEEPVESTGGSDSIVLGNNWANFAMNVFVTGNTTTTAFTTSLTLDDSADSTGRVITLGADNIAVAGLPASIIYSGVTSLNVLCGTGANQVLVEGTSCPTTISDAIFVDIGNDNSVQGIDGTVSLVSTDNQDTILSVDDFFDTGDRGVTITSDSITGLAPAPIEYGDADLLSLTVLGANGGSTYLILSTPATSGVPSGTPTQLTCGPNNDTVDIEGTSPATTLTVLGGGGSDTVNIDDGSGSVQGIDGNVSVQNPQGSFALNIADETDGIGRSAVLTAGSITGLAPGVISWDTSSISSLSIRGPIGPSNFTIDGNPSNTSSSIGPVETILQDNGADHVLVQNTVGTGGASLIIVATAFGTSITLGDPATGVQGITGLVDIGALSNAAPVLTVDDAGDTTGRNVTISSTDISGLAPAQMVYTGLGALNVECGSGFYGITVQSTAAPLALNGGGSTAIVTIGNSSSVQAINAPVALQDPGGEMFLLVDDSADAITRNVVITSGSITGLAPATMSYAENDLASLAVDGSKASSSYAINGTPASLLRTVTTSLNGGPNADFVQVERTSAEASLTVNGGGSDTVHIGDAFDSVQSILGSVSIEGTSGSINLGIFDEGDGTGRTATMSAFGITGLAPAAINWSPSALSALSVDGPAAPSTFTITTTPSVVGRAITTTLSDDSADQVFVQNTSGSGGASLTVAPLFFRTSITLGNPANGVQGIAGTVNIQPANNAAPALTVDDSGDNVIRTPTITSTSITALAPAAINFTRSQLSALTVKGGPALVSAVSGSENAPVGSTYDPLLQVKVTDAFGNPIANVPVTFSAPAAGPSGSFNALPTVPTNALGIATAPAFTANLLQGSFFVTATAAGINSVVLLSLTNTAMPAGISVVSGSGQTATVGGAAFAKPLEVEVLDAHHNPVSGTTVVFTLPVSGLLGSSPGGTFAASAAVTTNASGVATAPALTPNTAAGSFTVIASVAGVATPAVFTLTNGPSAPAAVIALAGTPQSVAVTKAFQPLKAEVVDRFGNPVSGVKVTFTAPSTGAGGTIASGTFAGKATVTVLTGANGVAAPVLTANTHAGSFTVTATATGVGGTVSFSLTNVPGPVAKITPVAGTTPQSAAPHATFAVPLAALVTDAFGNVENGAVVLFTVQPSTPSGAGAAFGIFRAAVATANASGIASLSGGPELTADGIAGTFKVIATVAGTSAQGLFTLTIT